MQAVEAARYTRSDFIAVGSEVREAVYDRLAGRCERRRCCSRHGLYPVALDEGCLRGHGGAVARWCSPAPLPAPVA